MTQRNSTPPAGVIQRVLALISPRGNQPIKAPKFPMDSPPEMRPRAASSPASWFEYNSSSLQMQAKSSSKESLTVSTQQSHYSVGTSRDAGKAHGGYAGSGARPKIKAEYDVESSECSVCTVMGNTAIAYCIECKEYLCQSCNTSHKAFKAMKHHNIFKLEDQNLLEVGFKLDQYCREHMVMKRFFCKTCDDVVCGECILKTLSCYDHQYVTLKEASKERARSLNDLIHQCKFTETRCQFGIKKTKRVEDGFINAVETAKGTLSNIKNEYISIFDDVFSSWESNLEQMAEERLQELNHIKKTLLCDLDAIKKTIQVGTSITERSRFEIVSNFMPLSTSLQEICNSRHISADTSLKKIKMHLPLISFHRKSSWKRSGHFVIKSEMSSPCGLVAHPDGDIAIVSGRNLCIVSRTGDVKHKVKIPSNDGVTCLPDGRYIIGNNNPLMSYNKEGKQGSTFCILDIHRMPISLCKPVLTIDFKGRIIAASRNVIFSSRKPYISIHNQDGSIISSFITSSSPRSLAATSNEDVVISFDDDTVQLVKYTGDNIRLIPSPPQTQVWTPMDVCCGLHELFIVCVGEPMGIFTYTLSGIYLGQVDTVDMKTPSRIAMSSDGQELLVLEETGETIQILERQ